MYIIKPYVIPKKLANESIMEIKGNTQMLTI